MSVVAREDRPLGAYPAPSRASHQGGHGRLEWCSSLVPLRLVAQLGHAVVVWLAVFIPYSATHAPTPGGLAVVCGAAAVWITTLNRAFAACYRAVGVGMVALTGTATGLVAIAAGTSLVPGATLGSWTLAATAGGVLASASVWEWSVQQTSLGRRRVLIVGTETLSETIGDEIEATGAAFDLVGCVDCGRSSNIGAPGPEALAELTAVVEAQRPDLIVLADERLYAEAVDRLLDTPQAFRVVGLSTFYEYALGRVPLHHVTPAWFMAVLHLHQRPYARWSKRAFDLAVSGTAFVLFFPLLPLIALAVRTTGRPIIYRQRRLGEGGKPFTVYKFRTMRCDAEQPGCPQFAAAEDDRATTVGRFLRRAHLDEIPQLWNVIKGDMSIVGPRPERPEFVAMLEQAVPFWTRRLLVKPGVTGWAQVCADYADDFETAAHKLSYDLWYIRHRRLAVDLAVCIRTAILMVRSLIRSQPACAGHANGD